MASGFFVLTMRGAMPSRPGPRTFSPKCEWLLAELTRRLFKVAVDGGGSLLRGQLLLSSACFTLERKPGRNP